MQDSCYPVLRRERQGSGERCGCHQQSWLGLEAKCLHPGSRAFTAASVAMPSAEGRGCFQLICPETANMVPGICQGSGSWILRRWEGFPAGPNVEPRLRICTRGLGMKWGGPDEALWPGTYQLHLGGRGPATLPHPIAFPSSPMCHIK